MNSPDDALVDAGSKKGGLKEADEENSGVITDGGLFQVPTKEKDIVLDEHPHGRVEFATFDTQEHSGEDDEHADDGSPMTEGIVLDDCALPGGPHPLKRWKSFDAAHSRDNPHTYSFRMPHDSCGMNFNKGPASVASDRESRQPDYNFVLDDYLEYENDTKIPRLRGKDQNKIISAIQNSHWAALCFFAAASCFLTYSISNHAPRLRAELSQAIVVALVLATFPEVTASAGAGAYAGMAGQAAMPNYGWLALLSVVVSAVWMLFHRHKILVGCGGRLGTCAFLSMNVTVALFGMPSGAVPWSCYGDADRLWSDRLELVPSILSVAACTFLSAVGGGVRLQSKIPLNPIQAPTAIALLCMLILEPAGCPYVEQIDAGLAVGSFVAMASDQYLSSVLDFAAAGFVAGLWILFLDPFFLNFGGKRGFTSFCGFTMYIVLSKAVSRKDGRKKS